MKPIKHDQYIKSTSIFLKLYSQSHMSAVQGGVIVLTVGAHCGKPQSQNACSPQLEEEEDHGKMYQQLYSVNLSSMQRHGKNFPLICSLYFFLIPSMQLIFGKPGPVLLRGPSPCLMLSPAEDMRGRIEADTSSSTLEEEFPPDLLKRQEGIIKDTNTPLY